MARPKKPPEEPITPAWFKVWTGWQENIQRLNNEQAGELLKAMMAYSIDGAAPSFTDATLAVYWDFMKTQLAVDRQKYITQVKSNRKAGQISAQNKAKKTQKKPVPKNGVFEAEKADGDSAGQQVLTSVNEEKKKRRGEEPKEPKEKTYKSDLTVSLDKATETDEKFINDNFDVDGYNMANDLWFKNNGRVSLTPKEKSYLRKCVSEHGAEFICGCIGELKRRRKAITTETLPAVIRELKAKAEAEKLERELKEQEAKAEAEEKAKAQKLAEEARRQESIALKRKQEREAKSILKEHEKAIDEFIKAYHAINDGSTMMDANGHNCRDNVDSMKQDVDAILYVGSAIKANGADNFMLGLKKAMEYAEKVKANDDADYFISFGNLANTERWLVSNYEKEKELEKNETERGKNY